MEQSGYLCIEIFKSMIPVRYRATVTVAMVPSTNSDHNQALVLQCRADNGLNYSAQCLVFEYSIQAVIGALVLLLYILIVTMSSALISWDLCQVF